MKTWAWIVAGIAAVATLAGVVVVLAKKHADTMDEFDTYAYYGED